MVQILAPSYSQSRADRNEHTIDQAREVWCETKVIMKRISTERESLMRQAETD